MEIVAEDHLLTISLNNMDYIYPNIIYRFDIGKRLKYIYLIFLNNNNIVTLIVVINYL